MQQSFLHKAKLQLTLIHKMNETAHACCKLPLLLNARSLQWLLVTQMLDTVTISIVESAHSSLQ